MKTKGVFTFYLTVFAEINKFPPSFYYYLKHFLFNFFLGFSCFGSFTIGGLDVDFYPEQGHWVSWIWEFISFIISGKFSVITFKNI